MSVQRYVVRPGSVLGHIVSGYYTIDMNSGEYARFKASTEKEQLDYIKYNAQFHPTDIKINMIKDLGKLEKM